MANLKEWLIDEYMEKFTVRDQHVGWTCRKCNSPVDGPYAKCNTCGNKPERKLSSTDRIPPITQQALGKFDTESQKTEFSRTRIVITFADGDSREISIDAKEGAFSFEAKPDCLPIINISVFGPSSKVEPMVTIKRPQKYVNTGLQDDLHTFLNMTRSLYNIDGYLLEDALSPNQQTEFIKNPPKYFINTSYEQQKAIYREVMKRQNS